MKINECLWEINQNCVLDCAHCYLSSEKKKKDLSQQELFKIADKLKEFQIRKIIILGGEPLLSKSFYPLLNYCISHFEHVAVETSGTLPSFLQNYDCTVAVSFESCFKDANDEIRKFAKSDRSVYELAVEKMLAGKKYNNVRVTRMTLYNDTDVLASIIFAEKLSSNLIMVPLMRQGCAENMVHRIPNAKKIREAMEICMQSNQRLQGYHQVQVPQWYLANRDLFDKYKGLFSKNRRVCSAGITRLFINYKGDVFSCPFMPQPKFGNLLKDKIKQIEKNINAFNDTVKDITPQGACKNCDAFSYCGGGCLNKYWKHQSRMGEDCPLIQQ